MPQVVEPDLADSGHFAEGLVVAVHVGGVERPAGGAGEDEAEVAPGVAGVAAVLLLAAVVPAQRRDALLRDGDASRGAVGLYVLEARPAGGSGEGAADGEVPGVQVEVVPLEPEQLALTESCP